MNASRRMALCGMLTALAVVILLQMCIRDRLYPLRVQ